MNDSRLESRRNVSGAMRSSVIARKSLGTKASDGADELERIV